MQTLKLSHMVQSKVTLTLMEISTLVTVLEAVEYLATYFLE